MNAFQITAVDYDDSSISDGPTLFKAMPPDGFVKSAKSVDEYFRRMSINYKQRFDSLLNSRQK